MVQKSKVARTVKRSADMIHSDSELAQKMEPAAQAPEAGPSNTELVENSIAPNGGSPVLDGDLKSPERANVNAIREALDAQAEMEVGKPIAEKEQEIQQEEAGQTMEVDAKPGKQIIINIAAGPVCECGHGKTYHDSKRKQCHGSKDCTCNGAFRKAAAESIGGEDKGKITSGISDINAGIPSFKVEYKLNGKDGMKEFSSHAAAEQFINGASAKFGSKVAWKTPTYGEKSVLPEGITEKGRKQFFKERPVEEGRMKQCVSCGHIGIPNLQGNCGACNSPSVTEKIYTGKDASMKVAYVSRCPGHRNSKGEAAPWCVKQHNTGKILESFKSESAAKEGLKNMESHKGSLLMKEATMPEKNTPEWHQARIALNTLRMPDAMVGVMGGMTKEQAKEILNRLGVQYKTSKDEDDPPQPDSPTRCATCNKECGSKVCDECRAHYFHTTKKKASFPPEDAKRFREENQGSNIALNQGEEGWRNWEPMYREDDSMKTDKTADTGDSLWTGETTLPPEEDEEMKFYQEPNGDYLVVDTSTAEYYNNLGRTGDLEGRATAIEGNVGSVQTTAMSQGFLDTCTEVPREQVPVEWMQMLMGDAVAPKQAGEGKAKNEADIEKEAGFNFFFPGQVLKEFYPEIQHEIVDYPNADNAPMGAHAPEMVGDGGHDMDALDAAVDGALGNMTIVEAIQLPADVGEVEEMHTADASTSPAGAMGIGRDGKTQVLEGAPLRKENDIRGPMFSDEFHQQYKAIPGNTLAIASLKTAAGSETEQFAMFLKKVVGEIAATMIAAFKATSRPLLDQVPGVGEVQLAQVEQPQGMSTFNTVNSGSRVKYLMDKLNDSDIQDAINDAWAQAAVWHDGPKGGYVYEVFVRAESIDTDSMLMKYKFVCGTRE